MSSNPDLTPPGSSTYSSGTMYVGDGTWDISRNTFLLPNLMGLNFETMRYNGMGNRFREMTGYQSLIVAHGVLATIVFLGIVPAAILIMRYSFLWDRYWALKLHAWLHSITLLLTTVVFMLGWFAVGPQRSLTNPHHGIGLAIYVIVVFQVLWGWLAHKLEKGKIVSRTPLILMIHNWIGRAVAILGIVQIPLGLTLYGSPKSLFILYSVGAFALFAVFFVLAWLYDDDGRRLGADYVSRGSYFSGPSVVDDRHHSNLGRTAAAAAAGAGLADMFRRRSRNENQSHVEGDSHTSFVDEKYSDEGHRGGWGRRLLQLGAIAGGAALVKRLFDRRRERESDTESGRYRPAHARSDSFTEDTLSRMEEGHVAPRDRPYMNRPPSRRPSQTSLEYSSGYYTQTDEGRGHGVRDAILGAGAFATLRNLFRRRREDDRVDEIHRRDMEEERLARANSKRKYTGDGFFPRRARRAASALSTDMSSTDITPHPPRTMHPPGESVISGEPVVSGGVNDIPQNVPIPPAHRHASGTATATDLEAAAAGVAAGAAAESLANRHHRRRSSSSRRRREDVASPPVSVKVKMHTDGRHVTLRRLTEEEAAASREARRRGSRRRHGSASSLSGNEDDSDRWRRVEEMERRQAEQIQREQEAAAAAGGPSSVAELAPAPPPPPGVSAGSGIAPYATGPHAVPSNISIPRPPSNLPYGAGSITSPGTWTGTEASADYANNRRRRRAERAQARQARQQQQHSVEFT